MSDFNENLLDMYKPGNEEAVENLLKFFEKNIEHLKKNITNEAIVNYKDDKAVVYYG